MSAKSRSASITTQAAAAPTALVPEEGDRHRRQRQPRCGRGDDPRGADCCLTREFQDGMEVKKGFSGGEMVESVRAPTLKRSKMVS